MKELYEEFLDAKNGSHKQKAEILAKLMLQEGFEKLIDYQFNRALTCFGEHRVYFVHLRVNGEDFLKVGYTKTPWKVDFQIKDIQVDIEWKLLK